MDECGFCYLKSFLELLQAFPGGSWVPGAYCGCASALPSSRAPELILCCARGARNEKIH